MEGRVYQNWFQVSVDVQTWALTKFHSHIADEITESIFKITTTNTTITVIEINIIYWLGGNYRIGYTNKFIEDSCIKSVIRSIL